MIRVVDVGAGLCCIVKTPDDHYLVYDGGNYEDRGASAMTALRELIPFGSNIDLMVDVGRIWRAEEAITRAPEFFERFAILWLEEPLHEDDIEGYDRLAASLRGRYPEARVAAGETEERESDFVSLLDRGVRVIQPDVGRAGGLSLCRRLSAIAHSRGAWCLPHCFGTGVNLAASAQWMAAAEAAPFMEYPFTQSPLRNELVAGIPRMIDGMVEVGNGPGLGITLDPTVIARYRVA